MSDVIDLAKELGAVGFPTLMVVILWASYKGWWVWGHSCVAMKCDFDKRLSKSEQTADRWQTMALRATGLAEQSVDIVKKSNGL